MLHIVSSTRCVLNIPWLGSDGLGQQILLAVSQPSLAVCSPDRTKKRYLSVEMLQQTSFCAASLSTRTELHNMKRLPKAMFVRGRKLMLSVCLCTVNFDLLAQSFRQFLDRINFISTVMFVSFSLQ